MVSFFWFERNSQLLCRTVCSFQQETLVTCNYPFPLSLLLCLLHFWSYFKLLDARSFPVLSPFVGCDGGGVVTHQGSSAYELSLWLLSEPPTLLSVVLVSLCLRLNCDHNPALFPSLSWQAPATYLFLGDVTFTFPWGERITRFSHMGPIGTLMGRNATGRTGRQHTAPWTFPERQDGVGTVALAVRPAGPCCWDPAVASQGWLALLKSRCLSDA